MHGKQKRYEKLTVWSTDGKQDAHPGFTAPLTIPRGHLDVVVGERVEKADQVGLSGPPVLSDGLLYGLRKTRIGTDDRDFVSFDVAVRVDWGLPVDVGWTTVHSELYVDRLRGWARIRFKSHYFTLLLRNAPTIEGGHLGEKFYLGGQVLKGAEECVGGVVVFEFNRVSGPSLGAAP